MRRPPERYIGYFYYFTAFILSALGLAAFYPYVYAVLIASLVFVVFAIIGCWIPRPALSTQLLACFKFWGMQSLGFLVWLIISIFWLAKFPYYGNLAPFSYHPSLALLLGAFILANELNAFAYLMKRWQKPASVLLFFPDQKANLRLAVYGNIWFRRATMLISFFLFLFSASNLIPKFTLNAPLFIVCACFGIMFVKSPLFYRWLQKGIRQWRLNFMYILLLSLLAFFVFYFFMRWLLQPFFPTITLDFSLLGNTAPLVVFWGAAICITVPLAYLMPSFTATLSPKAILVLALTNPLLWILLLLDFANKLLPMLYHIPHPVLVVLSIGAFFLSLFWLGSQTLARLNTTFFMNDGTQYGGKMPRILMQNNIPLALGLMTMLSFHAAFWFQVEFLATGSYVLVAYFVSTCIYLFRLRKL